MQLHPQVLDYIAEKEGLRLKAYLCPAGRWTIGYGNTFIDGRPVKEGDILPNKEAALKLFKDSIEKEYGPQVERLIRRHAAKVGNWQFSALVSYVYNRGIGNTKKDLEKVLNDFFRQEKKEVNRQLNLARHYLYLSGLEIDKIPAWVMAELKPLMAIRAEWLKGYFADGKPLTGLLERRKDEIEFFFTPDVFNYEPPK